MISILIIIGSYLIQFLAAYILCFVWNRFGVSLLGLPTITVWVFLLIGYTWSSFLDLYRITLYRSVGLKETVVKR